MAKASINIKAASATSELHNKREIELDYNYPDLEVNNESWELTTIEEREKEIKAHCKVTSGRKLQKNATPIREGVVNLKANHTMDDLKELAKEIKEKHKIDCFQIHIHRDEGKSREDLNYHAHMVFDWQDKETGKTLKLGKASISQLQDTVAESLKMERGELRVNSNRKRLEPIEYKRQQEELRLKELQPQIEQLEQKKNRATERNAQCADEHRQASERHRDLENTITGTERAIRDAEEEIRRLEEEARELEGAEQGQKEASRAREREIAVKGIQMDKEALYEASNELSGAIELQQQIIEDYERETRQQEREITQLEESNEYHRASILIQRIKILRDQEKREERKQEYLREAGAKMEQGKKPW
jgi:chromosome segregation ATPase